MPLILINMFYLNCSCVVRVLISYLTMFVVRGEAHLEDGTLVAKSDDVEFTVSEGVCYEFVLYLIS